MSDNPQVEPADKFYNTSEASEPNKPTEEAVVTLPEDQVPVQDEKELDKPAETEVKAEGSEAEGEAEDALFVEIDGEEHNLEDIKTWRDGHMMQSDYTKKTQTLAEERTTFEADRDTQRETLTNQQAEVTAMRDQLEVLVTEDEAIDWAELKESDPDEYIRLKEKADKRKDTLENIKAKRETPVDDPAMIQGEIGKLHAANPDWFDDDGKPTETYKNDAVLIQDYATVAGFTTEEFSQLTRAHHMNTILKAAKYDQLQEKGRKIKETREKVPVVTKPKAKATTAQPKSMAETFYGSEKAVG